MSRFVQNKCAEGQAYPEQLTQMGVYTLTYSHRMRKFFTQPPWFYPFTGVVALCFALMAFSPLYHPAKTGYKQRIVCFKFKTDASSDAIAKHMRDFARLKKEIPLIVSYTAGKTLTGDKGAAPEYDVMHYLTFKSEPDIETYFGHPKHKQFIQENKASWDKVLVSNANTDE